MFSIFVNNIPFSANTGELRELFIKHGPVREVRVLADKHTGRPRGCAVVEMLREEDAQAAISALNGIELYGRQLEVEKAHDRGTRGSRGAGKRDKRW